MKIQSSRLAAKVSEHPYTLVICSHDPYIDVLPPLFTLFRKYWPGLDAPIVLNTETGSYRHEGFDIFCPGLFKGHRSPTDVPWSRCLRETLTRAVSTDLVLIYLDDFYLYSPVNESRLAACVAWMRANPRTACVYLSGGVTLQAQRAKHPPWLSKRLKNEPYLFSLQAGLWRRDRLLHFLRDHESPWHFERWGSIRGRRYPDDFYQLAAVAGVPTVFDYCPNLGLSRGKWFPGAAELFEKERISMDCSIRGFINPNEPPAPCRRNWFRTAWNIWRSLGP